MKPRFFRTADQLRNWLENNHESAVELWVGFRKKASGQKSLTYAEALDEALCFGWIDGVRKAVDETAYTIRFTRRKPRSIWSRVNVEHVERLTKLGRMKPAGLQAYAARDPKRTGIYSFETAPRELSPEFTERFAANEEAWRFFQEQPPYYKKTISFWVMNAKKEETRLRRLEQLIDSSARRLRHGVITGKASNSRS